jgi:uncharacterized phiE125 gp8 family phage protein
MTTRIITQPSVEPVSLQQAKQWCRIDDDITDQDAVITMLVQAMREYAEDLTGRAFVQRTMELTLPCFPSGGVIEIPSPPLISVTHVKYYDLAGALQTVDPSVYEVDTNREPGLVRPAYLESWEPTRNVFNAVRVRYEAGYAPVGSPTDYREMVPARLKVWMQARLSTLFEHREQLVTGTIVAPLPRDFADGLLDGLRIANFFR